MAIDDVDLTKTEETFPPKISVTKLGNISEDSRKGGFIAWECAAPQIGQPYKVFICEGVVLRTSLVRDVKKTNDGLIVKTLNSVYRVTYL